MHGDSNLLIALRTTNPHALVLQLKGVTTNLEFLREIAADPRYAAGDTTTKFVEGIDFAPHAGGMLCYTWLTTRVMVPMEGQARELMADDAAPARVSSSLSPLPTLLMCSGDCAGRSADHRAGLPRPRGAVERGCAALWPHGRSVAPVRGSDLTHTSSHATMQARPCVLAATVSHGADGHAV